MYATKNNQGESVSWYCWEEEKEEEGGVSSLGFAEHITGRLSFPNTTAVGWITAINPPPHQRVEELKFTQMNTRSLPANS